MVERQIKISTYCSASTNCRSQIDNMMPICEHGTALTHPTEKARVDGWAERETDLSKLTFPSLISFCKSSTAAVYVI
jgi:hypothetical protein